MPNQLLVGNKTSGRRAPFRVSDVFVTETAGILARRGAGKTYCGHVLAEEFLESGQQVVVIDPLNAWWGLRSSANGKSKGYPVVVFGGPRGDLPLDETMGEALADLVVESPISCVLSLRHLTKGKSKRFVDTFATRLFHRKGDERFATPLHVFIDEADQMCPQRVMGPDAHLVGAIEDLVRRGRQAGIGITMITQRAASLNKDVLTQVELLITGQITGPQDKKAILEWIKDNADEKKQKEFMSSLAMLETGQFWFWSPAALKCFDLVKVRKKRTFDSSATPKPGKKIRLPKKAAKIDLSMISDQIKSAVKSAERNDPKILRRKVVELEKELKKRPIRKIRFEDQPDRSKPTPVQQIVQQGYTQEELKAAVTKAVTNVKESILVNVGQVFAKLYAGATNRAAAIQKAMTDSEALIQRAKFAPLSVKRKPVNTSPLREPIRKVAAQPTVPMVDGTASDKNLSKCERALLTVLAQLDRPMTNRLLALQSGYSVKSSGFANAKSTLRTAGLMQGGGKGPYTITPDGHATLGSDLELLPSDSGDLLRYWLTRVGKCQRAILGAVADAYPESLTREQIAEQTSYSANSSGFANALSTLRGLQLIQAGYPVTLSEELMG